MSQAVPLAIRLLRTKDVGGVSATSLEGLLVSSVWWLTYSIEIHNIPSTISSAVGLTGTVIAVITLARLGGLGRSAPLVLAGVVGSQPDRCPRWLGPPCVPPMISSAIPQGVLERVLRRARPDGVRRLRCDR
jgi:hypothetical protein